MHLDDFKAAALRVFYDIVNADGIIDINEIKKLDELKIKYSIVSNNGSENIDIIDKTHSLTFGEALDMLRQWRKEESNHPYKYTTDGVREDAMCLANIDSDCSAHEALLLVALLYMTSKDNLDGHIVKMFSCPQSNLKFSKSEIIYVENDYDEDCNRELKNCAALDAIKTKLKLCGFDFVYIPDTVRFLSENNLQKQTEDVNGSMLAKIMMFSHPLLITKPEESQRFAEELIKVTTSDFVNNYFCEQGQNPKIGFPALMVKVKTSTKIIDQRDGEVEHESYVDFLLIAVQGTVINTVNAFINEYITLAKSITNTIQLCGNQRVSCRGFHKTLIDYVVYRAKTSIVKRVIFEIDRGTKSFVIFEGTGLECQLSPTFFLLYLFIALKNEEGVRPFGSDLQDRQYWMLTEAVNIDCSRNLNYDSMSQYVCKIQKKMSAVHIKNKGLFIPYKDKQGIGWDLFRINAPIDIFYVRTLAGEEISLQQWIERNNII